ncbi:GCG_CRPN prefix-to-repeats domain-containing protein [Methylobacterium oryzihabitans]|uniref:Uncharacterized protein n=1 Tax=Methylobacterium oryzihabitans TaxID=2499852 RepID=A0A3S2V4A4_9HYPH|nr:hypothetical protein [Methylobacterium oryzihabitans]RVU13907.1 hypothetical protein EOE48_25530 [Methylobacterium oryzihabitans]
MRWKMAGAAILALGTLVGTGTMAEARDGCGPGFHQGVYGACRPNLGGPAFFGGPVFRPVAWHWHRHYTWHTHWHWHRFG